MPRTGNSWNFLPSSCFLESFDLSSLKSKINRPDLDLISLSSWPFVFFFLSFLGLCIGYYGLSSTHLTKKSHSNDPHTKNAKRLKDGLFLRPFLLNF